MAGGALSFREDPFRLTPDRRYIFETDGFRRAFTMLLAGIRARRGVMLLTGPSGTGKTTLLQGLLAKLQQDGCAAFWRFHPDIPGYDLVGSCLAEMEVPDAPAEPRARAQALATALKARTGAQPAVLIVDEVGQFADAQLAEIASLPAATDGALQVVLAGLPAFAERLDTEPLTDLRKVIVMRAKLGPLERGELGAYIAHRCRVAGQSGPLVFEPQAIARVFDHTGGTPRLVNRLCATALFFAAAGSKHISAEVVDEAARACSAEASEAPKEQPAMPPSATPAAADIPEQPVLREPPSEVHRTLAEAERAWIGSSAAVSALPAAPDSKTATASVTSQQEDQDKRHGEPMPAAKGAPVLRAKRRSPVLRIAASVVVVAGSAAAVGAILWPTDSGREYLAESAPMRTVARLAVSDETSAKPESAPDAPIAEASTTVEPVTAAAVPQEPAVTTIGGTPAAALTPEPPAVAIAPEPAPEPVPLVAAIPTPEPVSAPASAATEPTAPATAEEPASEPPPAVAASLSSIEPANGPEVIAEEEPAAAAPALLPAAEPVVEPAPVVVAAVTPPAPSEPVVAPPPASPAEPAPVAAVAPAAPAPVKPRVAQTPEPLANAIELDLLMKRGDDMLRLGDPASARLFYERAATRGLARGYTAVGRTFDPSVLQRLNIRGGGANGDQALTWYRRGIEAGDADAAKAAKDLTVWLARPR